MHRSVILIIGVVVVLFGFALQSQAQLAISAASAEPVDGWQRLESIENGQAVWVDPTPSLTEVDIHCLGRI